ncbi:hypothetical protein I79_015060 [Cricetulus griseus]|uniref:Uncharacterized protein n=1 Tax=Cricetulus griseus TaxID=10029 RepID=G3HVR9_CRIGR|nr:hypothetical protein I79_015060 [Cricetulus griseus]
MALRLSSGPNQNSLQDTKTQRHRDTYTQIHRLSYLQLAVKLSLGGVLISVGPPNERPSDRGVSTNWTIPPKTLNVQSS